MILAVKSRRGTWTQVAFCGLLSVGIWGIGSGATLGEEVSSPFKDVEMTQMEGEFIVSQENLNVRAEPGTGGERLSQLEKGEKVTVIGKAKGGEWYAVRKDNKDLGFVYGPVLLRLIDGRLDEALKGTAKGDDVVCDYTIRFENQNEIEGELMRVADYWGNLNCRRKGKKVSFPVLMFLTELPYSPNKKGTYQIGVEVAEVGVDYDRALSSIAMYDFDEKTTSFDSVSPSQFTANKKIPDRKSQNVAEALTAAIEISIEAWNDDFWKLVATK